jgi:hypothetical protein
MLRLSAFVLFASLAACGGDSGSGTSGVETTKKLNELSSSERQQLCEYMEDAQGGVHSKMCGDGVTITTQSAAECATDLGGVSTSCTATVENAEACAEAAGDDLCNLLSSPACSFIFECQ